MEKKSTSRENDIIYFMWHAVLYLVNFFLFYKNILWFNQIDPSVIHPSFDYSSMQFICEILMDFCGKIISPKVGRFKTNVILSSAHCEQLNFKHAGRIKDL